MAVKALLTLLLFARVLSAELPFQASKSAFDLGLGSAGETPYSVLNQPNTLSYEVGTAALYEYGFRGANQLCVASGAIQYRRNKIAVGTSFSVLEAFNLYREILPTLLVGYIHQRHIISGAVTPALVSIPGKRAGSLGFNLAYELQLQKLFLKSELQLRNLEKGSERNNGDLLVSLVAKENRLGAQGIGLEVNLLTNSTALSLSEVYRLSDFCQLTMGVKTKPLFIHLGLILEKGSIEAGALFVRHERLGWSKGGFLQNSHEL